MAFVHRQSCEGVKSELDLFAVPPTQTSIEEGRWVEHQPLTSLDSGGPIEFILPGTGDAYLDLANTYLLIRAKVVRWIGTDLADDTPVGPVNNWLHSLFSQVDVYLNDTLVTPSSNTYPYRAYVETLLSYGDEAKNTQLTSQLWYKDTAGHMEATTENDGNLGLAERRRHIAESRVVEMMGRLHVDLFLQERFLLNGVSVKIRLVRSKDSFSLMAGGQNPDYKVQIVDAVLFARKAVLSPTVQMAQIKALEKGTAKYPLRPVDCKVYSIPQGAMSHTHENLFLGTLPKRLILWCIDNDAYNGEYSKNPFNAKNNAINFLAVYLDGRQVPAKPLQPNFEKGSYIRSYVNLFSATGKQAQDEGNALSRDDFGNGYTFFGFDLTPDGCDGGCFHLVRNGNLRIEIHFAAALAQTVNVVVYGEFEAVLEIDKGRNVIYDYWWRRIRYRECIEIHFAAALAQTVNVVVYGELEAVLEIDKGRNVIYDFWWRRIRYREFYHTTHWCATTMSSLKTIYQKPSTHTRLLSCATPTTAINPGNIGSSCTLTQSNGVTTLTRME